MHGRAKPCQRRAGLSSWEVTICWNCGRRMARRADAGLMARCRARPLPFVPSRKGRGRSSRSFGIVRELQAGDLGEHADDGGKIGEVVGVLVFEDAEEGGDDAALEVGEQILTAIAAMAEPAAVGVGLVAVAQPVARRFHWDAGGTRALDEGGAADRTAVDAAAAAHEEGAEAGEVAR